MVRDFPLEKIHFSLPVIHGVVANITRNVVDRVKRPPRGYTAGALQERHGRYHTTV
jgi:hypothetical protein